MRPPGDPAEGVRLRDIADALGGEVCGESGRRVQRIAALASAGPQDISFVAHARLRSAMATTAAGSLIVRADLRDDALLRCGAVLVVPDPYLYYARLTQWWLARVRPAAAQTEVHASAVVDPTARLGQGVRIAALAVVEAGAVLGDGVEIGSHCHVGEGVEIGSGSRLAPHVTLMPGTRLGLRCLLHSGAVIGADGFGFAPEAGRWVKIEPLGGVVIGDDVEIGANTCIDRGALDDTRIGNGVKLDNLIQIGHNVQIGDHTAMAGCTGVAGSARIGSGCTIGGAANILGHLELADGVHISTASVVMRSIRQPGLYSGVFPIDDNASWEKNAATLRQLHSLRERVRALEKKTTT